MIRRLRRTSQKVRPLRFFFWRVWEYQVFKRMFTAWKTWILVAEVFTAWKRAGSLEENSVVTQSAVPGGGAHLTNDAAASVGPHHADLEDCRRILLASASRIDVGGGKPYRFASLDDCDSTTFQIVMMYCAPSPSAQMNQIGVSSRRFNIAWRRMHRGILREWIENIQCHLGPHMLISDLEDILCLK